MDAPGLFTRMQIARGRLERTLDAYHNGAYLLAIGHVQAPQPGELERWSDELEDAYVEYRAAVSQALRGAQDQAGS
ncbi:MAG TPA: hypothetical protein VGJ60_07035 [Chloroflexota bacterium]|jgi:hypothetical protein